MILKEEIKETGNFDIVVCGGGVAGIASAVSASRKGKKVLLIEKRPIFGRFTVDEVSFFIFLFCGVYKNKRWGRAPLPRRWR